MSLVVIPAWPDNFQVGQNEKQMQAMVAQLQAVLDPFLLLPAYLPKWRTTAAQLGLFDLPFWSPFDALQKIQKKGRQPLQLNDLTWPKDAQFVRMFDRVVVLSGMVHYANVFFTYPMADQIDRIDLLEEGKLKQQLTVDDRGFISRILDYDHGVLVKLSYLSEGGAVVAEEDYQTGHVQALLPDGQVNQYQKMADLLVDLTVAYLTVLGVDQAFVEDGEMNRQIVKQLNLKRLLLWTGQAPAMNIEKDWSSLADHVTLLQGQRAAKKEGEERTGQAMLMAPYPVLPSKLLQRKKENILYFQVGDIGQGEQRKLLEQAMQFVLQGEDRTVVFEGELVPMLFETMLEDLIEEDLPEQSDEEKQELKARFVFLQKLAPAGRFAYLATASFYIDLSRQPDLLVLAAATALGLPTLTKVDTAYTVLDCFTEEMAALSPRLHALLEEENWQQAHQATLEKAETLREKQLEFTWKNLLQVKK
ncbi:accessory Sec system glycosyltransferase Asp1 [Fructobacillus sp. M158]|uniref:accessory Sec system glycosyltransferase Asp1 n=1 Tax=Fructobacillus parabroussonetiae TaxID=2713174 RepID=UPI00200B2D99|nr:accessory Sec system glycosyltransferase Asp1 [Fructobacillus parabroussonetiae]